MKEIIVQARMEYLEDVISFVKECLTGYDIDSAEYALELGIEEIFINIVNYAYPSEPGQTVVRCEIETDPVCCRLSFMDRGIPFNPMEKEDPDLTLPMEERPIGGLGIFLIRKLFNEVTYEYKDGYNTFTILKKI